MGLAVIKTEDLEKKDDNKVEDPEQQAMIDKEEEIKKKYRNQLAIPPYTGLTT